MKIFLNNQLTELPHDHMTVAQLVEWQGLNRANTAVAINDRLVKQLQWGSRELQLHDRVTLITAAFGG